MTKSFPGRVRMKRIADSGRSAREGVPAGRGTVMSLSKRASTAKLRSPGGIIAEPVGDLGARRPQNFAWITQESAMNRRNSASSGPGLEERMLLRRYPASSIQPKHAT